MIKYYSDSRIDVSTVELPQDGGEYTEQIVVMDDDLDSNYFLEFECPKSIKCVSGKLVNTGENNYEIKLPYVIMQSIGDVYVQLIKVDRITNEIVGKSLISSMPVYTISRSIMAGETAVPPDKEEFFDYAVKVATTCGNVADKTMQLGEKISKEMAVISNNMNILSENLVNEMDVINNNVTTLNANIISDMNIINESASKLETDLGVKVDTMCSTSDGKIDKAINNVNNMASSGKFNGDWLENAGEWKIGNTYYAKNNNHENNKISIVHIKTHQGMKCYTCNVGSIATKQNMPPNTVYWKLLFEYENEFEVPVIIYDYKKCNLVGGVAYPQTLPNDIVIDLSAYKIINVHMQFYEVYTIFSTKLVDLYRNSAMGGGMRTGLDTLDATYFTMEYNDISKLLKNSVFVRKFSEPYDPGTKYGYGSTTGIRRIEGILK